MAYIKLETAVTAVILARRHVLPPCKRVNTIGNMLKRMPSVPGLKTNGPHSYQSAIHNVYRSTTSSSNTIK